MKTKKLVILFVLLLIPQLVSAGVISLTTIISTDLMTEDTTKTHVKLLNSGDEPAYNVQISLLSEDFESNSIFVGILSPNEPFEGYFNVSLAKDILSGNYPVTILVDYADANSYPFSSVSPNSIIYKSPTTSMVSGDISEISLSGKKSKKLVLNVRNLDDVSHDVNVELILPRELKVADTEKIVSIGPKEEKQLNFEVSSVSALVGSSYVALASLEYEDGLHHSSFARGIIKIVEEKPFEFPIWLPILSFCMLLIIFVYYFIRGKK